MDAAPYVRAMLEFSIIIPAAWICYCPMHDLLKYSPRKTFLLCALAALIYFPLIGLFQMTFSHIIHINVPLGISVVPLSLLKHRTLRTNLSQSAAMFLNACALMSFPSSFAYAFDAWLHPTSNYLDFSFSATLFQLALSFAIAAAATPFLWKHFAYAIRTIHSTAVWNTFLIFPVLFTASNVFTIPLSYQTLHTGRMFQIYVGMETLFLLMLFFIYAILYRISYVLAEQHRQEEHTHFLQLQLKQYQSLQEYMDRTRQIRHDFRHSIHALSQMAHAGDMDGITRYLHEYEQSIPPSSPLKYCNLSGVNALLNYYRDIAAEEQIQTNWNIHIPALQRIPEPMLCGLLGNILENAVSGCSTVPPHMRYFNLTIDMKNTHDLYIVSSNSFNGVVVKHNGEYLSTKHSGKGIGLSSIAAAAKEYGGTLVVSHTDTAFYMDVVIQIQ